MSEFDLFGYEVINRFPDEGIEDIEFYRELFEKIISKKSLSLRAMMILHVANDLPNYRIDWKFVNKCLNINRDKYDYRPSQIVQVFTKRELNDLRNSIALSIAGMRPYQTHICKDCGKQFSMYIQEVAYFRDHKLHIPKRCHKCRNKRKKSKNDY
jgi:hypothetical protein